MGRSQDTDGPRQSKSRKRNGASSGGDKADFAGFVNYSPTAEQKEQYAKWVADSDSVDLLLSDTVADGYKFTIGWDRESRCYVGSVAIWTPGHPDAGIVLTLRAQFVTTIVTKLLFALLEAYPDGLAAHLVRPRQLDLF
jgi:hypothetical protein